jgi:hypothetical protein
MILLLSFEGVFQEPINHINMGVIIDDPLIQGRVGQVGQVSKVELLSGDPSKFRKLSIRVPELNELGITSMLIHDIDVVLAETVPEKHANISSARAITQPSLIKKTMLEPVESTRWIHGRSNDSTSVPLMTAAASTLPIGSKLGQSGLEGGRLLGIQGRPDEPILEIEVLDKGEDNRVRKNEIHGSP